jgi:phage terminase large subunit GpA-like protein
VQKSAQVGFSVFEMLAAIYLGLKLGARTVGMFLPDQRLADMKSSGRFMDMVRSVPGVHRLMRDPTTGRLNEGNKGDRRIGGSRFVYSWTSGRMTTESEPMDIVSLDEVQEMTLESIEKLYERLSASNIRFMMMGSTANWPEADINYWYHRGSQYRFHTRCPTCGAMEPLDAYFPACIQADGQNAHYVCREGHRIDDPQAGEWKPDHPELEPVYDPAQPRSARPLRIRSIHFPQMLSSTISPREILDAHNAATNQKNFHNRKLGKPFVDPDQTPVTLAHLRRCVEAGRAAGVTWARRDSGTFMGIDQMGNFNVVWIKNGLRAVTTNWST